MAKKQQDVVKQMDELLGKPPVPVSNSQRTFNAKEDELLNLRVKLQKKEQEINEKESFLKKELKELEQNVNALKKSRAQLWQEVDELKRERDRTEIQVKTLEEELQAHRKQIKYATDVHAFFLKKQEQYKQEVQKLTQREQAVSQKEQMVSSYNKQIKEQEQMINRLTHVIHKERAEFQKKREILLEDINILDRKRTLMQAQLTELTMQYSIENKRIQQAMSDSKGLYEAAEKKLQSADKEIQNKQKAFSDEIGRKHKELEMREEKLAKYALHLDKREFDLQRLDTDIKSALSEMKFERDEEVGVRKNIIEMTSEERLLEQQIADRKNQLQSFQVDYDAKMSELKRDHDLLNEKEDEIITRIKQLEQDEKELSSRENDFIDKINELENDQRSFDRKVNEFSINIERIKTFDAERAKTEEDLRKREMAISKIEKDLEEKTQKILRTAEYKASISGLKKDKETLSKQLKELQSKTNKAYDVTKKLMMREKAIKEREELIMKKETQLKELLDDMAAERTEMLSNQFGQYMVQEAGAQHLVNHETDIDEAKQMVAETHEKDFDALVLIKNAREALQKNDIEKARQLYARLNAAYKKLPATEDKKKIYYEILGLKTDIELSTV